MRTPDLDRARSEKKRTLDEFLALYNASLPPAFPAASTALLEEFRTSHKSLFPVGSRWTLDRHRKEVMDWLNARRFATEAAAQS
jgi:hypothetical protein